MIFSAPYPFPYHPRLRSKEDAIPGHDLVTIAPHAGEVCRVLCECGWSASVTDSAMHCMGSLRAADLLVDRVRAHEDEERAKGGLTLDELEALGWFDAEASV